MKITLMDNAVREFDGTQSIKAIATSISTSLGKDTIGAVIDGKRFLMPSEEISVDCQVELIIKTDEREKHIASATGAAVVAATIRREYGADLKLKEIKTNANGSFRVICDFRPFQKEDLESLKKQLNHAIKQDTKITANHNGEYTIGDLNLALDFIPFELTSKLKQIEIFATSAFQYDDEEKAYQMIYGIAATSTQYIADFIKQEEEKKKSDHRYIGKQLEIFTIDPLIGQGLPIWLPNGTILKDEIKKYLKEKEWEYDFIQIQTPVIGTSELYKTSGHWDHYRDDMFAPMDLPKEEMVLKPMSCPHHIAVYNFKPRSYRDLPLRFAEHALQHRYESSGSLTGLERVRAMELTDSHIFCRADQIKAEFKHAYRLIEEVLETFHIKVDYLSFSVRDPQDKEKYFDDDKMWNDAEQQLQEVLEELGVQYVRMEGEAAFYGPKLDIQAKTVLGHEITVSTIQLDFLQPSRFNLSYINSDGELSRPVMIHRGLVGTYERFISVLLEQTSGVLPLWLAPRQVDIIPVNLEEHGAYCQEIHLALKQVFIRSEIDTRDERINYKIRDAQVSKIPYTLVIGSDEAKNNTVTYRPYGTTDQVTMALEEFVAKLIAEIKARQ